jgi:hypothetical protein
VYHTAARFIAVADNARAHAIDRGAAHISSPTNTHYTHTQQSTYRCVSETSRPRLAAGYRDGAAVAGAGENKPPRRATVGNTTAPNQHQRSNEQLVVRACKDSFE